MENHADSEAGMSSSVASPTSATTKKKIPFREVLPKKGAYKKVDHLIAGSFNPWRKYRSLSIFLIFQFYFIIVSGLIFHESEAQAVLCKPKLLPLKSFTLEKLEKMQKEATVKAQETILEKQRQNETDFYSGSDSGKINRRQIWNMF